MGIQRAHILCHWEVITPRHTHLVLAIPLCPCCSNIYPDKHRCRPYFSTSSAVSPWSCLTRVVLPTPKCPINIHRTMLLVKLPLSKRVQVHFDGIFAQPLYFVGHIFPTWNSRQFVHSYKYHMDRPFMKWMNSHVISFFNIYIPYVVFLLYATKNGIVVIIL